MEKMAENIKASSVGGPGYFFPSELSEVEALRQLLEGVNKIDISFNDDLKETVPGVETVDFSSPEKMLSSYSGAMFSEAIRLYQISPNLLRICFGKSSPVEIRSGMGLLKIPPIKDEIRTQLYQILQPKAVEETMSNSLQTALSKMRDLPWEQAASFIENKMIEAINTLFLNGDIKKVTPEEACEILKEPFVIEQMHEPIKKNLEMLEFLGVPLTSPEYEIMSKDPDLMIEVQVAQTKLCVTNELFLKAAKEVYLSHDLSIQSSELEIFKKEEREMRGFLDKYYAWGQYYLERRNVLIEQYQNRPLVLSLLAIEARMTLLAQELSALKDTSESAEFIAEKLSNLKKKHEDLQVLTKPLQEQYRARQNK